MPEGWDAARWSENQRNVFHFSQERGAQPVACGEIENQILHHGSTLVEGSLEKLGTRPVRVLLAAFNQLLRDRCRQLSKEKPPQVGRALQAMRFKRFDFESDLFQRARRFLQSLGNFGLYRYVTEALHQPDAPTGHVRCSHRNRRREWILGIVSRKHGEQPAHIFGTASQWPGDTQQPPGMV